MPRETKTFPLAELKIEANGTDAGSFEGRASTFGSVDSYGDVVVPGAYRDTIPDFLTRGFIGWGHDWKEPVGIVTAAEERTDGLYVSGQFHSTQLAQQARTIARERVDAGKFMGLSIGYEAEAWEMRQVETPVRNMWGEFTDKVRALTRIKLFETSLVLIPAEPNAGVTTIKGYGLSEEDHSDRVRVAVQEYVQRLASGSELRRKEGRAISSARRARMEAVMASLLSGADEIKALLDETAPPEKAADVWALFAEFQHTAAALSGAVPFRS